MTDRTKTNSETLKSEFPELYQNFFSKCQIVASSADSFFWAGEYARFFGGLSILQKLPTKNYIGLEFTNDNRIRFANELYGYSPSAHQFNKLAFDPAKERRLISFLEQCWSSIDTKGKLPGFRIHLLSESHCGGGLGTNGVILACLATCLLLASGKITLQDIESWQTARTADLLKSPKYNSFRLTFQLAWRLTAIGRGGSSSGATSFAALIHSPYPIIFISKSNFSPLEAHLHSSTSPQACEFINRVPYWGGRLEEIFPINMPQPWPIDIGRCFSGSLINTEIILKSLLKSHLELEELREQIQMEFLPQIANNELSAIFEAHLTETSTRYSHEEYLDIFNYLSLRKLFSLKELFITGLNEETLRDFIQSVNNAQSFNYFLGHSTELLDNICNTLTQTISKENEYHLAAAKIEGIGKGGHVLFFSPKGSMPKTILDTVKEMAKKYQRDIFIDWASWLDGYGESGINAEQFLDQHRYSSFISQDSYRLMQYRNGTVISEVIDRKLLSERLYENDLALLVSDNQIYIGKQKLTSKDLPSTKATISILKSLLENPNRKLDNRQFSNSSYGQSRYDLQSKIFIPLNKALAKISNKKLDYQIHGGIYDNFTVSLEMHSLSIAVVEKIG